MKTEENWWEWNRIQNRIRGKVSVHYREEVRRIVIELSSRLSPRRLPFSLTSTGSCTSLSSRETFLIHASSLVRVKTPILVRAFHPSCFILQSSNFLLPRETSRNKLISIPEWKLTRLFCIDGLSRKYARHIKKNFIS